MLSARVSWAILLLVILQSVGARAQGHNAGHTFIAGRVGTNLIGNTYRVREAKPVAGAGASLGTFLSPAWALELEGWVRASNPECCAAGRETLVSLSVVRQYGRNGIQPYALGGVTLLRAHANEMQVQVGVGAQVPVYRRVAMALDVRGNGGGSAMIVRPTLALIYYFR
jgi:hypothetical protein